MRDPVGSDTTEAQGVAAPVWRWGLPRIAGIFIATRLLLLAVAVTVERTQPAPTAWPRWTDAPLLASLTIYDGRYYLGIAASGYHAAPVFGPWVDYAFFPLYPAVVRIAAVLTLGNVDIAGVLVANIAFGLALVALYALSILRLDRETALVSLAFLALAPGAVAFGLAYSDSLYLLLALCAFLLVEKRRSDAGVGVLFALAALARPPGILLGIPLVVAIVRDPELRARRAWAWLILGPLALALFSAWLGALTGDPLAWLHAQSLWDLSMPPVMVVLWTATAVFYGSLFLFFRRDRMPPAYWLVALLPFLAIVLAGRVASAPRYLGVAWPFDWSLALRRPAVRLAVLTAFMVGQMLFAWLAFSQIHPP